MRLYAAAFGALVLAAAVLLAAGLDALRSLAMLRASAAASLLAVTLALLALADARRTP
ncbi:MAG: hypothetical protein ACKOI0_03485 [Actinomycetota bacterium]